AVGARMGMLDGSLAACGAILVHHLFAAGASALAAKTGLSEGESAELWRRLERKFGDHAKKLVFLFGLITEQPHIVRVYWSLAMGVGRWVFVWNSSVAHMVGAVVFVSLGGALLRQNPWIFAGVMLALVALLVGLAALKRHELREN